MENILSQIPQSVIERYVIREDGNSISLYSNPKDLIGYISLPKDDLIIEERISCLDLSVMGKFSLSLYKEIQHTHLSLF
jgi:hypothetical protein